MRIGKVHFGIGVIALTSILLLSFQNCSNQFKEVTATQPQLQQLAAMSSPDPVVAAQAVLVVPTPTPTATPTPSVVPAQAATNILAAPTISCDRPLYQTCTDEVRCVIQGSNDKLQVCSRAPVQYPEGPQTDTCVPVLGRKGWTYNGNGNFTYLSTAGDKEIVNGLVYGPTRFFGTATPLVVGASFSVLDGTTRSVNNQSYYFPPCNLDLVGKPPVGANIAPTVQCSNLFPTCSEFISCTAAGTDENLQLCPDGQACTPLKDLFTYAGNGQYNYLVLGNKVDSRLSTFQVMDKGIRSAFLQVVRPSCAVQAPSPEPCYVFHFSEVADADAEFEANHCSDWGGLGLANAQGRGKVFCEYNSRGCNRGSCQCYGVEQGTKGQDGRCYKSTGGLLTQTGARADQPMVNLCSE